VLLLAVQKEIITSEVKSNMAAAPKIVAFLCIVLAALTLQGCDSGDGGSSSHSGPGVKQTRCTTDGCSGSCTEHVFPIGQCVPSEGGGGTVNTACDSTNGVSFTMYTDDACTQKDESASAPVNTCEKLTDGGSAEFSCVQGMDLAVMHMVAKTKAKEPETTPEEKTQVSGACTNDADQKIWTGKGKSNFEADLSACGKKCLGAESCVASCMSGKEGYSSTCAACFGQLTQCTEKNCLAQCTGGKSPACAACVQKSCTPAFTTCSGITDVPNAIEEAPAMNGGSLMLTWKDCGDASTHTKITAVTPPSLPLGGKTTITGTGTLDKDVSDSTFDMKITGVGGIKLLDCSGDASQTKTCKLPLGTGTMTFEGESFPVKQGTTSVKVDLSLASSLPASLQKTTTTVTAVDKAGEKIFCLEVDTAPADEEIIV
jgi:hypothetical protein